MNKKYLPSALILYLNYFIHGVGCSILGQAVIKEALAAAWGVEAMAITAISAALGLGRLIALPFAGPLSDKLGRRISTAIGSASYAIYLIGLALAFNAGTNGGYTIAYVCAVLGGIANSFLDTGIYPAVSEIIYKAPGVATMGIKFFIAIAQMLLPFVLGATVATTAAGLTSYNRLFYGCGIIYISHKMAEIKRISDEITIMRDGTWVATEKADDLSMDDIIRLMVGRELTNQFPPKTNKPGEVALEVEHLTAQYSLLNDVSFNVRKGEIVGIAGLDGSGRTETLENIFGIATRKDGVIKLDGKVVKNRNARESIKNGFALLTEERRATGIFGILSIRENTVISSLKKHKKAGLYLSEKSMKKDTQWSIDAMRTKTPTQETKIRSLSGGNQQKVILGRWLLTDPEVLLLDEPTRGIDVGAKYEIYQLILDLANRDKVVMVVSSEMPELLGICDRILVMSGGRLAGEVDAKNTTQEEIMALAAKYV